MTKLFSSKKAKIVLAIMLTLAIAFSSTVFAFAADGNTAKDVVLGIIGIISFIAMLIGIVLLIWGVIQLILAFRNEDSDSKTKAVMAIVVGIALVAFKFLAEPLVTLLMDGRTIGDAGNSIS